MDFEKCEEAVKNIRHELKSYVFNNNRKALVLGVSGGIDSAVCCVLAKPVCDEMGIPLIGRSLPIESEYAEIERASAIGKYFCTDFKEMYLTSYYEVLRNYLEMLEPFEEDDFDRAVRRGNIKARLRMVHLYHIAHAMKGLVLSASNYTEHLLSFWTIGGDIGDFGMIRNLWKTEIYGLAKYLHTTFGMFSDPENGNKAKAINSCIEATPTDGLGITNSDFDQLGADSYDKIDKILQERNSASADKYASHPVIKRYKRGFKRKWPISIPRHKIFYNEGGTSEKN